MESIQMGLYVPKLNMRQYDHAVKLGGKMETYYFMRMPKDIFVSQDESGNYFHVDNVK